MTGMDEIRISGLQVYARHGVYEEEKKLGQRFLWMRCSIRIWSGREDG